MRMMKPWSPWFLSSIAKVRLLTAVVLLMGMSSAAMAVTVSASPGTCASVTGIGTVNWGNPTRATSSNNSYATASNLDGTTSRYLECTNYGFAIPAGAIIDGITVNVQRKSSSTSNGGSNDAAMLLVKAGTLGATDRSMGTTYTTSNVVEAHGSATDLWGDTWTAADINDTNFGAAFAATKASSGGNPQTVSVDWIQIVVDYTPVPIAEYRFDETSAGSVTDSSVNKLNGSLNGGVTVGGNGQVCTGYHFNGSDAFVSVPNKPLLNPTQITVAAWVRHNTATIKNWETILAKGDSAYRLHLLGQACSLNSKNTLGALTFGVNGGCAGADVSSGVVPVAGTWYHVVGTYDGATIKIYVDGAPQGSAAYASTIASNTFPLYIGENAQQTGRYWSGDLDEVKIFSGALTAAQISAGYANESAVPGKNWDGTARVCAATGPDHYELSLPSTSITCLPTTVTVTACKDISPCNPMTTLSGKTALLATSAGALTATTVTFDALGVASTTLSYPAANDGAVATVTLSGEQVTASNARKYCPDGANCVAGNSGPTTFKTAGFIFSTAADAAEATFSSQTAGVDFGPYWLRAVKTDLTTKACEAALTAAHPVNFNYQCLDPSSCSSGSWLKIGSSSMASSGATVNLAFDANGSASLGNVNFADVGQIKINASATAGGATLIGSTKETVGSHFVVKPYSLVLTDIKQTASPNLANPAALNEAGNKFVKAGENFSVTVTSVNASCAASLGGYTTLSSIPATCITPNYGQEATRETVALSNALVPGLGLSANPALNNATAFGSFAGGSATGTTFSWGEVGIITLTPSVGDGNYLGAGNTIGTPSGKVGRFYPDHFDVSVNSNGTMTGACQAGGFTYTGQPMGYVTAPSLTIKPMNAAAGGGVTQNYQGGFQKLAATGVTVTVPTADASQFGKDGLTKTALTATMTTGALTNSIGTMTYTLDANDQFTYTRNANALIGPYTTAVPLVVTAVTESEVSAAGALSPLPQTLTPNGTSMRYGRARMFNAYGSELLDLPMTLRAEYWNGTGWVQNIDDNCTGDISPPPLSAANAVSLTLKDPVTLADSALTCVWDTGNPGRSGRGCASAGPTSPINKQFREGTAMVTGPAPLQKGDFNLWLQRPIGPGSIVVNVDVPTWLEFNWTGAVGDPSARATFGIYKSPLIYRRENY